MENAKELKECLCCGSERIKLVLDLKEQPMANSFKESEDAAELTFPLRLNLCEDCTHLQLSHAVNPDLLFKNYLYVSGTSKTLRDYFDWFAKETLTYAPEAKIVLDIACNDGSQLNSFKTLGLKTYGIDPAENLHELSNANHEVVCDYFKEKYVYHYKMKQLDIITAQNVFAHNDYPLEFLQQCKEIMHDDSVLFIQTSQGDMIKNNEFDTIYHEHLSFFNASSMSALAQRAGLYLIDIRKTPIHGNSYMFVFKKVAEDTSKVDAVLAEEQAQGLQDMNTYLAYADRCHEIVKDLAETIKFYKDQGTLIVGYGAAAKGMTLINFGDLYLDFIIDDNPLKQGLYCPGSGIPVVSVDMLDQCEDLNVAFIPLAWNFFTEIRANIKKKRDREGDVFIKYFPTISIN